MIPLYSIGNDYFRALFPDEIVGTRKIQIQKIINHTFAEEKQNFFFNIQ